MFVIDVKRIVDKPIDLVFAELSDHENYSQFRGIDSATLLKQGETEKNGLAALREIKANGHTLHEEIVNYKPPHHLAYKIVYSKPLPYDHQLGDISLTAKGEKTHVRWQSKGHIAIPILGKWFFDKQIQKFGSRAFGSILKTISEK